MLCVDQSHKCNILSVFYKKIVRKCLEKRFKMDKICISCLAQNRNLSLIDPKYWYIFQIIIKKYKLTISDKLKICWECKAHLQKFDLFIERAQNNYILLQCCSDFTKLKCQSPLSIKKLMGTSQNLNSSDSIIKSEYVSNSQDCYKIDILQNDQKSETLFMIVKNEDAEKIKIEDDRIDCTLLNDEDDLIEEDNEGIQKTEESMVNPENPIIDKYCGMWTTEIVSEEQLHNWRNADENVDRYQRLHRKCTTCIVAFNYEDQLQKHNIKYHCETLGPHKCDVCQARFPEESLMKKHRQQHLTLYKCLICQFSCREYVNLKKHLIDEHVEASIRCDQCDAVFKTVARLRYHRDKHMGKYECRQCNKIFTIRNNMYSHMAREHGNLPKEQCHICKKTYKNKYALKTHLKVHAEAKEAYYCASCDVHFKSAVIYKHHIMNSLKHLKPEDLKYKCEECDRRFATEKRKQEHYETIHLKRGQFACDKCSKSYSTRRGLKYHTALKHEGNYVEPPRDKICDVCGRAFPSKTILTSHIRTHTGERPYKCKLCPSTFAQSGALYTHRKLVHEKLKRKVSKKRMKSPRECQWEKEKCTY